MNKLIGLVALLAASAATAGNKGADGYTFAVKAMNNKSLQVQVVEYPSEAALTAAWIKADPRRIPDGRRLMAFSQLDADSKDYCVIHIVDPKVHYAPESVGHELLHCIYGDWHPVEVEK